MVKRFVCFPILNMKSCCGCSRHKNYKKNVRSRRRQLEIIPFIMLLTWKLKLVCYLKCGTFFLNIMVDNLWIGTRNRHRFGLGLAGLALSKTNRLSLNRLMVLKPGPNQTKPNRSLNRCREDIGGKPSGVSKIGMCNIAHAHDDIVNNSRKKV